MLEEIIECSGGSQVPVHHLHLQRITVSHLDSSVEKAKLRDILRD